MPLIPHRFIARFRSFIVVFAVGMFLILPTFALAQVSAEVEGLVLPSADIRVIIANIIRVALGFLGVVALSLILYGGFVWMTAAGNEERIAKAKKVLINATIGLAIILSALAIVQFVIRALTRDITAPPLAAPRAAPGRVGGGALGSGIIESHFPMREARDVARNTRIVITFKQPIDPASIAKTEARDGEGNLKYFDEVDAGGENIIRTPVPDLTLRTDAIQIIKTADITDSVRESDAARYLGSADEDADTVDVLVSFTNDLRTFVFTPVERSDHSARVFFGSAAEKVGYTVYLCGTVSPPGNCAPEGLRLFVGGQSAFQGRFNYYQWSFWTGTFLDLTPPKIRSVVPFPDNAPDGAEIQDRPDVPRNIMLQINFSEAVLPTVASGVVAVAGGQVLPGGYSVMLARSAEGIVEGRWDIGNQYRTSEFVSAELCGQNSCGEDVFCLPRDSEIEAQILAATLGPGGGPASAGLFDGIEDMAGNSFDGNGDGQAAGPGDLGAPTFYNLNNPVQVELGDNARFSFFTSGDILLIGPTIESTLPVTTLGAPTTGAPLTAPVEMSFDRFMAMTTLNSRNLEFEGAERVTGGLWDSWWTVEGENLEADSDHFYGQSLARILHGGLWEETDYVSAAGSGVRDLYQNCFYPSSGSGIFTGGASEAVCSASQDLSYCCNGAACAAGDLNCQKCGFGI